MLRVQLGFTSAEASSVLVRPPRFRGDPKAPEQALSVLIVESLSTISPLGKYLHFVHIEPKSIFKSVFFLN